MLSIANEVRRARKSHTCLLCGRTIGPGEIYRHQRNVDCGDIWTWRNCAHCDVLLDWLYTTTRLYDWDEGATPDSIGEWEPETIAEARLKIYWRHQWRTRSGELRPVPVLSLARSIEVRTPCEAYL